MKLVITGAAGGIGRAVAQRFLASPSRHENDRVLLVDQNLVGIKTAAAELGEAASFFAVDLADVDCGEAIIAAAVDRMGGVDAVASNAGLTRSASLAELGVADYDRMFNVTTRATWLIAKAAYPMMRQSGGSIVATASVAAVHPAPLAGVYSAAKAALVMLMRQLANEWGPDGIRCNAVSPGSTVTPMTARGFADPTLRRDREASTPLRRLGMPEDVADAILFLLGPQARQITGIDLTVDGGLGTTLLSSLGRMAGAESPRPAGS